MALSNPRPHGLAVPEDWREPSLDVARVMFRHLRWSMRLLPRWNIGIPAITAIRKTSVFNSSDM